MRAVGQGLSLCRLLNLHNRRLTLTALLDWAAMLLGSRYAAAHTSTLGNCGRLQDAALPRLPQKRRARGYKEVSAFGRASLADKLQA